jgi:DNA repair exonuclease SbcCD ATPase subunit
MKTMLMLIVVIAAVATGGYLGLPVMIDSRTAALKTEIEELKQRLHKMEDDAKTAALPADADTGRIIKMVNALSAKTAAVEKTLTRDRAEIDAAAREQRTALDEALKKQADALNRVSGEMEAKLQKSIFSSFMADVRGHVLKVKVELASRNIGTAKNELELISELFERAKVTSGEEQKRIIEELQGMVRKIRTEVDTDLPAAVNRVDTLWHDMSRLLRKV